MESSSVTIKMRDFACASEFSERGRMASPSWGFVVPPDPSHRSLFSFRRRPKCCRSRDAVVSHSSQVASFPLAQTPLLHFRLQLPFQQRTIGAEKVCRKCGMRVSETKGSFKAGLDSYLYRSTIYSVTEESPLTHIVPQRQRKLFRAPEGE